MKSDSLVVVDAGLVCGAAAFLWITCRVIRYRAMGKASLAREILLNLTFAYSCFVVAG